MIEVHSPILYEYPTVPSVTIPSDRIMRDVPGAMRKRWDVVDPATGNVVAHVHASSTPGAWVLWAEAGKVGTNGRMERRGYRLPDYMVRRDFPELLDVPDSSD